MVKDELKQQEAAIGEAVSKTETFFENHSKAFVWGIVALFVVVGGVYGFRKLVIEPRAEKVTIQMTLSPLKSLFNKSIFIVL